MALDPLVNFGKVTVSTGYDASATSIVLAPGEGAELPATFSYNLVWWNSSDYADPSDDPNVEIVRVSGKSTDTISPVARAQEGTSATAKNIAGKTYKMILAVTKKMIDDIGGYFDGTNVATQFKVDNLQLDGNTISSLDENGDILLSPNGSGDVSLNKRLNVEFSNNGGFAGIIYNTHATAGFGLNIRAGNDNTNDALRVQDVGGGYLLVVEGGGNIMIGTSATAGTSAAGVLAIANGTAPTSSPADMIQLYAEDVSSSSELKVRDEAGNVTTLSPHNFSMFLPDINEAFPFSYHSRNNYIGKEINVDIIGAIREIEKMSGKRFIYIKDLPSEEIKNWSDDQETQKLKREQEIQDSQNRIIEINALLAEEEDKNKITNLEKEKADIVVPKPYVKKQPPQWMRDRGISLN